MRLGCFSAVLAWPILLPALDNEQQTASLTRKLLLGVRQCCGFSCVFNDHENWPTPGNPPKGNAALLPKWALQSSSVFRQAGKLPV